MGVARGRCWAAGVVAGVLACVLAVAPSGSADPSSVAVSGVSECVPDRSTIAQCFPDKALAQDIAKDLKGDAGKTGEALTSQDVNHTTGLYPNGDKGSSIASVQGLQVFTNLTELDLPNTKVSDVSPLARLTNLWVLRLSKTQVSDVSPLARLTNLDYLDLSNTQVLDLSVLHGLSLSDAGCGVGVGVMLSCVTEFAGVRPSVKLTVNGDGSVSMPAPRWLDGTVVAPSSTSPAGGVLDVKRGVVTWKKYDLKASYSYDFKRSFAVRYGDTEFSGHVTGVKPTTPSKPTTPGKPTSPTTPSKPAASTVTMYRLYNKYTGEYFYTSSAKERDSLVKVGWRSEGTGWVAPVSGAPVYRLYNPYVAGGDHHYTMSVKERDALVKVGWRSEGVGWYSGGSVRVLREYNPYARTGTHNYTTDPREDTALVKAGWRAEGVGWYAVKAK